MPKEKEIKEMEHIEAQEHFGDCRKCQEIFARQIKKERERIWQIVKNWKIPLELKQRIKNEKRNLGKN